MKLRLVNEMDSDHPMHHPFHIHGTGRFVVLARNGVPEANYVWKDTVLVRTAETVDILLDVTNPGRWMAHCHIAEHHESGMMLSFDVAPRCLVLRLRPVRLHARGGREMKRLACIVGRHNWTAVTEEGESRPPSGACDSSRR